MNFCYKAVLTVNATSWMLVVYGIKSKVEFYDLSVLEIGIALLFIPIILSLIAMKLAEWLEDDSLSGCHECSLADNEFLPVYLGYFFVSLSVPDNITMGFLYGIVFVFTWFSQTQYFNPLYLLLGYHYYHVLTKERTRIFIIVRGNVIRNRKEMSFEHLKRLNDTTYLVIRQEERK